MAWECRLPPFENNTPTVFTCKDMLQMKKLQIDEEFKSLIPPLSTDEYTQLEENIKVEGCRDPLVTWNDFIIDGHHRFSICKKHNIDFKTEDYSDSLDSRDAVIEWMLDNQLGKRNSHPNLMSYMRGLKYLKGKGIQGKKSQNGTFKDSLASELGVSKNTILRDAKFAQAVDTLSEFKNEICTGKTTRTKQEIVSIYDFLSNDLPEYYTPDKHVLYNNPTEAGTLTKAFKAINQALDALSGETYKELQETKETQTEDGRELVLWKAVDKKIDIEKYFFDNLDSLTVKSANNAERKTLLHVKPFKDIHDVWKPVMSDEEYQKILKAQEREKELETISKYTPNIINGDTLKEITKIPTESVDLIVTDPPYNMDKAEWDSYGSGEEFSEWAEHWLKECFRVLKPTGSIYVFGINRMLSHIQMRMERLGFNYKNWIVWDTIQGAGGGLWVNRQEAILYYSKNDKPYENNEAIKLERAEENIREYKGVTYEFKNPSNIWRFPVVDNKHKDRTSHPTQKPVELIERIVKANSKENDTVLDCFMGSGTTGVACMKLKRKCIGFELSKEYIDISNDRFSDTKVGASL